MIGVYIAFCEDSKEKMHKKGVFLRDTVLKSLFPDYTPERISTINEGKPILENISACFSLSHSKGGVAFAVGGEFSSLPSLENTYLWTLDETPEEIGVDIESLSREINFGKMMKDIFSESECEYVKEDKDKFIEIFTKKESLCKLSGNGIRDLRKFDVFSLSENIFTQTMLIKNENISFFTSISYKK